MYTLGNKQANLKSVHYTNDWYLDDIWIYKEREGKIKRQLPLMKKHFDNLHNMILYSFFF